ILAASPPKSDNHYSSGAASPPPNPTCGGFDVAIPWRVYMQQSEMVALIRGGVPEPGGVWADLGAGTGNFSWALAELIGPAGTIYAIDRDAKAIRLLHQRIAQADPGAAIIPQQADLTRPLDIPVLDGVLIANALH